MACKEEDKCSANEQQTPAAFPLTAADLWHEMENKAFIIPTGCKNLDELMEGGLYSGEITELCGAPGVGKTQLCYSVTMETCKASTSAVAYLSSNCSFNASRLLSMLAHHDTAHEQDDEDLLERIRCYAVCDIFETLLVLSNIQYKMASQHDTFHSQLRLIVIDNITILISPLLGDTQFEGHAIVNHLANTITKLAQDYCLIILIVNNTVRDVNSLDEMKPALGNSWAHVPSTRLMLHCSNNRERIASILKSSRQKCGVNASYYVTRTGLNSQ